MKIITYINERLKQFAKLGKKGRVVFDFRPFINLRIKATLKSELLFCISTANSKAINGLRFQKLIENINLEKVNLGVFKKLLAKSNVRFYNVKASYMVKAIKNFEIVKEALNYNSLKAREILVKNTKGLGYKEASHFLRNVGREDVAIIDRHILRFLVRKGYIKKVPERLNKSNYIIIEKILRKIAKKKKVTLAKLDLLFWYKETRMVLK